jgi:hypothetical protein
VNSDVASAFLAAAKTLLTHPIQGLRLRDIRGSEVAMKIPKFAYSLAACLAGCAISGVAPVVAQEDRQQAATHKELPPSPLEAFASRSTATVVWSKTIGRLETRDAQATLTVVALEDQTTAAKVMRGLRIDLAHTGVNFDCDWKYSAWHDMCERGNAAVYVEEGRLEAVRNAIAQGSAELRPFEFISEYGLDSGGYVLESGLIVCGYQFSDRKPSDLAKLFTSAIAALRAASR